MLKPWFALLTTVGAGTGLLASADGRIASLVARPGSRITGVSHAIPLGTDSVRFTIDVRGAPARSEIPWAVHQGSCGSIGGVHGNPAGYPRLVTDFTGETFENVVLTQPLEPGKEYAVVVHRLDAPDGVAACGDFKE